MSSIARLAVALSLTVCLVSIGTNGASLLDLFNWDEAEKLLSKKVRGEQDSNNRNCLCKGPACICCVDLNITFVDLGGPGCVHMKYLSPEEGFAVNVSYGKSMLHSSKIKGANSPPICLDVFSKFAQMCARFSELAPTTDGLRGCLQLEPRLLGDTQIEFPLGCFRSSANGMEMEDLPAEPENDESIQEEGNPESESGTEGEDEDGPAINAEALLHVVNHTAEQGIAFFASFLGLAPQKNSTTTTVAPELTSISPEAHPEPMQTRRGKVMQLVKHPNVL